MATAYADLPRLFSPTGIPLVEALEAACRPLCIDAAGRFDRPSHEDALQAIEAAGITIPTTHRGILEAIRELDRGYEIVNSHIEWWEPIVAWKWKLVDEFLSPAKTHDDVLAKVEVIDTWGDELICLWAPEGWAPKVDPRNSGVHADQSGLRDSIMRDIASLMVP